MRKKGFIIVAVILAAIILTIGLASCDTNESGTDVTVIKHTVTFDVNGGNETYSSREYEAGATLTDLPTPTRDGYEFDCWKDSDGYEYSVGSVMPDRDITLVAQWIENTNTSEKHEMRYVEPVDPSCVNKGNIGYWHCEICNRNFTDINGENPIDEVDLPMLEHELEFVPCNESSCVQEGNIDYYYCKNCNKLFNDADAKTELLEKDIIIPATGLHQIEDEWVMVKEPTISELGLKEKKCKTCSYKITQDVEKINYEYTEGINYELNEQGTGYEANGFTSDFDVNCTVLAIHAMYKGLPVTSIKTFTDDNNKIAKFIIPETIKTIGDESSFYYYYSAHKNMLHLKEFYVVDTNPYFCSVDGVLYNKDMTELVCYPMNKIVTTFNIPSTVKTLRTGSFAGAKISVLNCNEGLEVIEGYLFSDANDSSTVVTVNLPSTLKVLGMHAFTSGMKIENINGVPSTIEYVDAVVIDPFMESYQYTYYKGGMYLGNAQNPYLILARNRYLNLDITVHPDTKIIASGVGLQSSSDFEFVIPDNVERVCGSIYNDGSLGKIYIGKNAKLISDNPFGDIARYLTEIAVSEENPYYTAVDGVLYTKDLKKLIYYPCDKTDRIYSILQGCEEIAPKAFAYTNYSGVGREMLQQIILPDTLKKIGSNAFENRVNLREINIPESVSEIGEEAFLNCNELREITLPDTLTIISMGMFHGCSSLKTVNMPNSITIIEDQAFWDCGEIETINIPENVKKIGNMAFDGCCSLKYVIIPESVMQIGSSAFATVHTTVLYCETKSKPTGWNSSWWNGNCPVVWDCKNNSTDENGYIYIEKDGLNYGIKDNEAYLIGQSINLSGEIVIPEKFTYNNNTYTVTKIDQRAFINCRSIASVFIPKSVTSIGYATFSQCSAMTIYCEVESQPSGWNKNWKDSIASVVWDCNNNDIADDGYIYTYVDGIKFAIKDGTAMLSGQRVDFAGDLIIPSKVVYKGTEYSVTKIGNDAFANCSELTSVIIPDSVESIEYSAFYDCNSLVSVIIGNGVINVRSNAFKDCSALENVTIGNNVTSIGEYAFRDCYSLTNAIFKNTQGWWYSYSSSATSGTSISSPDLSDPSKAANYLSDKYSPFYWKRS